MSQTTSFRVMVPRLISRYGVAPTEISSVRLLLDEAGGTVVAGVHDGGVAVVGCGEGGGHEGGADWVGQVCPYGDGQVW